MQSYSICPLCDGAVSWRVINVVADVRSPLLFKTEYCFTVCTDHIVFILLPINGHMSCFYLLGIVNDAAMRMGVQTSV